MSARIYRPAKTAMQSGRAQTRRWQLVFDASDATRADPVMGWQGSADTRRQVRLRFDTKEQAIGYAERHGLDYLVEEPRDRTLKLRAYADNFK